MVYCLLAEHPDTVPLCTQEKAVDQHSLGIVPKHSLRQVGWRGEDIQILSKTSVSTTPFCLSDRSSFVRLRLKSDGTRAETRSRLSAKRTSPFKSAGASVQSTNGSRAVRISGSNAGYTKFRGSVKSTGYPLHSPVLPSLPLPCVTVCHHVSTGLYVLRL